MKTENKKEISQKEAPLHEHLAELRKRLIYTITLLLFAFIVAYSISEHIYGFLVEPLANTDSFSNQQRRMIFTGLTEAFFTYVKLSFYTALFITLPFILLQLYLFLAPGLYKKEKFVIFPFFILCPLLFLAGASMVYYFIFPMAWEFFVSFESIGGESALPVQLETRVSEYLSLVLQLIFAFGLAFQLPIFLTLLARIGFISSDSLKKKRKYMVVVFVILAAILTPPDVISQIGLALALLILYECSIILCKLFEDKKDA